MMQYSGSLFVCLFFHFFLGCFCASVSKLKVSAFHMFREKDWFVSLGTGLTPESWLLELF